MTRKVLAVPLLLAGMAFFMQCSDEILESEKLDVIALAGRGGPGGGGGGGGGGETETAGNNLSFPVFMADGFGVPTPVSTSFTVPYTGDYTGLTTEEIAYLEANGEEVTGYWYPQKTDGNAWQADFSVVSENVIGVSYIDWGDVLESVSPTSGRPTRVEVTLYADATKGLGMNVTMTGYTMALLEYPSSPNEQQGTNTEIYESNYATIVSPLPKLVIQYVGDVDVSTLTWDGDSWQSGGIDLPIIPISFAPELNVGGKYIYGASSGGWRPTQTGKYRLTYYIPEGSDISLEYAEVGNFSDKFGTLPSEGEEPTSEISTPVIVYNNTEESYINLTYHDVVVVNKGGGGGGSGRR